MHRFAPLAAALVLLAACGGSTEPMAATEDGLVQCDVPLPDGHFAAVLEVPDATAADLAGTRAWICHAPAFDSCDLETYVRLEDGRAIATCRLASEKATFAVPGRRSAAHVTDVQ